MSEPRTAAGRALLMMVDGDTTLGDMHKAILAIEAEAAHPADLAEALLRERVDKARQAANESSAVHEWPGGGWLAVFWAALAAPQTRQPVPEPGYADWMRQWLARYDAVLREKRAAAEGSEPLDVERLARALNLVTYGEPAGKPGPAAMQEAEAIAAAYASQTSGDQP